MRLFALYGTENIAVGVREAEESFARDKIYLGTPLDVH